MYIWPKVVETRSLEFDPVGGFVCSDVVVPNREGKIVCSGVVCRWESSLESLGTLSSDAEVLP